ncbi:MAG TPA: GtrA family protein [Pararobbsia sp.]|jgi:putative flippase GtrA|nr:GtrA family protein [Pararobbsia sp.]
MTRAGFRQFVRYAIVGAAGTATQYAVLGMLMSLHVCEVVLASGCGVIAGALVNYALNYRITFRATTPHRRAAPRFFAVAGAGLGINSALMYGLAHRLGMPWLFAQVLTTACILVFTYVASLRWTFHSPATGNLDDVPKPQ